MAFTPWLPGRSKWVVAWKALSELSNGLSKCEQTSVPVMGMQRCWVGQKSNTAKVYHFFLVTAHFFKTGKKN